MGENLRDTGLGMRQEPRLHSRGYGGESWNDETLKQCRLVKVKMPGNG
jgi:hypothetical protein